ncbi:tRNA-uridine aminocarboxypropyltransferase 2 isoform X3 [Harpia harpyja]|uniref:tRNA-uridine aminocarboxypropyltransferase 2 isoform X3 n=1 Tax=Harpia harpyja TaxID=202280 RepID=UPI0022B1B4A6|nr:tRNA-uridine aminocarboxypropyltransferase 2 isoform X3 [Harpia harpyja]
MAVWLFLKDLCLLSATGTTKSSFWLHWPWVCQMSLSHLEPSSEGVFMSIPANTSAKGLHLLIYNSASSREAMLTDRPVQVSGTVKGRGITYCRTADRSQESRVLRTVPLLAACLPPDKYKILVGRRFSEDRYPELATVCRNPSTLILYPGAEATNLEEVAVMYSSPSVMIIIDGTWSQAKDIFYKNSLFRLPKQTILRPLQALCSFQLQHGAQIHHSKEHLLKNGLYDKPMPKNKRKLRRMELLVNNVKI